MKILIPKENPSVNNGAGYVHAAETLMKRAYLPHEFTLDAAAEWVHFNREVSTTSFIKSFTLSDFYVLTIEDISPLERIIYGV